MIEKAKEKIKSEMEKNKNSYVQVVGNFLLQHLEVNPVSAEKINTSEKTIEKSLDEMRKAAEKKKVGNCAVLTDQEGFDIVLKYFGIEGVESTTGYTETVTPIKTTPVKSNSDFDVKLEDLL